MSRNKKITLILAELTLVIVLAGLNRKATPLFMKAHLLGMLNVSECFGMLVLAPWATMCAWRIFKLYEGPSGRLGSAAFVIGVFFLGLGFGMHEPFNAMDSHLRMPNDIHAITIYFDDDLGHWLFFIGFAMVSLSVALAEIATPDTNSMSNAVFVVGVSLGVIVAVVIWFNMRNEKTVIDIAVLFATVAVAETARRLWGKVPMRRLPSMLAVHVGYGGGALATIIYWGIISLK